jgi:hypothetical protein|tara:strand:+ start:370 stop:2295 length:1926 start_codon:yes stop_codon:yes gene_type:complete
MNEQVMVYEIKSSADSNSDALFHTNGKYFYWNQKKFNFLKEEDYVIVVNTHSKYVLLTKLAGKDISIEFDNAKNTSSFNDKNQKFIVSGKYDDFVRLEILAKYELLDNWQWKSLGSSETTYLNGSRINKKASINRIKNIAQLKELSTDNIYQEILEASLNNFNVDDTMKEEFKKYLNKFNKKGSQKASSYIRSLDLLDIILNSKSKNKLKGFKSIYNITSQEIISNLHLYILKEQKNEKGIFKNEEPISYWRDRFYSAAIKSYLEFLEYRDINVEKNHPIKIEMEHHNDIKTAIQTKPFIILAGISGTGKSRLVRELAFKSCNNKSLRNNDKKPGNYEMIPVKPNWHDSSDLLGYISRINGEKYITTPFLKFIVKAWKFPNTPFFLCLDEMNLAPVEQYFAEYLSIIETRSSTNGTIVTDAILDVNTIGINNMEEFLKELDINDNHELHNQFIKKGIQIPNNLVVMGTVNMDETTHSFSRKVLDRAMTIEMNKVDLFAGLDISKNDLSYPDEFTEYNEIIGNITIGAEVYNTFKDSKKVIDYLSELNEILEVSPFKVAYRVRDEFLIYCHYNSIKNGKLKNALDQLTVMKVLSRIEGDESKVKNVLNNLSQLFLDREFSNSKSKINEMTSRLEYGYTSFWS